ncbi:DUF1993 family protein [bacterium]|nr:DUF1993 family protein [bacterium]
MSLSMYQASAPVFVRFLENFALILEKAAKHAEARKINPSVFVQARLAPDMFPLARQVQIASDIVKGGIARLAGVEVPSYADTESSFAELQERVAKTIAFIQSIPADKVDGSEDRAISLKLGGREVSFQGQPYLLNFVIPNFYFHLTAAYAILRHNGVDIGKQDFLGAMDSLGGLKKAA